VARLEHSKLTMAGTVMGSVRYMAPEQMMGETVDGRADVFSLGAVAYEILTGRPAFPGASITEIVARVVHGRHVPPREVDPRLPEGLNDVFAKVFTRLPQDRYPRATDFAGEFQEVSAPVAALPIHHVLPSASPTEIIPPAAMARRVRQAAVPAKVAEPARVATSKSDAEKGRGSEGVLLLDSEPSPAKVWIDGHPVGETPLPRVDVTLGRHVVRMEAHGREAVSFAVELTAERPLKALTCALPVPHPANAKLKPGQFVPFGPEVVPPKRVRGHPPAYPEAAHERGLEGAPVVELWINEKGDVIDVAIVESAGALLDAALLEAVAGWSFQPATLRGTPVTVKLTVQHVFRR
jgi:TonB family protein